MRQETAALKERLEKFRAEASYKMALDCEEAIALIEEIIELRAFVQARNDGLLAPNPPRVVTLGNPWMLAPKRRLRVCVEAWPECEADGYNPRCCRFPKSCSCTVYQDDIEDSALEPVIASTGGVVP